MKAEFIPCVHCGQPFRTSWQSRHKYCSIKCRREVESIRAIEKRKKAVQTGLMHGVPIEQYLFRRHLKSADRRGIPNTLTFDQFILFWQQPCWYCGSKVPTIGLDRRDGSGDYNLKNVVSCCPTCNKMKRDMTDDQFLSHCQQIIEQSRE